MKLGCILASAHAVVTACLGWLTWPVPFHGLRWLRVADFIVVWDAQDVGLVVARIVGQTASLDQVSTYSLAAYFASFVAAGSFEWFVIGVAIARLRARFCS